MCYRYLRFTFTVSTADQCMSSGCLSRQAPFDLHYCRSSQTVCYPEVPDMGPNSCFSVWTKFRGWEQKRTRVERIKICKWLLSILLQKGLLFHELLQHCLSPGASPSPEMLHGGNGKGRTEQRCSYAQCTAWQYPSQLCPLHFFFPVLLYAMLYRLKTAP